MILQKKIDFPFPFTTELLSRILQRRFIHKFSQIPKTHKVPQHLWTVIKVQQKKKEIWK